MRARTLGAEHFDGARIAETCAGAQRVGDVLGDAVVREHGGGNAALGEAGVAVFEARLGDQRDGVFAAELECSDESGDAAAYDDDVLHAAATSFSTEEAGLRLNMRSRAMRAGMATSSATVTAVEHVASSERLQHPRDVAGVDSVHGRTGANDGVETERSCAADFGLRAAARG